MTRSTPACAPIALAVRSLSPVSITTSIPIFCSSLTACGESSLITSATAIMPSSLLSSVNSSGVFPWEAARSAVSFIFSGSVHIEPIYFRLPPCSTWLFSFAFRPFPGSAENSVTSSALIFISSAFSTIALASGCSDFISSAYAFFSSSASSTPGAGAISVTFGSPLVIVPVLSSATICTSPAVSSDSDVLNRTPFLAARPLPTIIATGVASPSAHGHEMTSTVMPRASASARDAPAISHPMTVIAAMPITNGTK